MPRGADIALHRAVEHDVRDLDRALDAGAFAHRERRPGGAIGAHTAGDAAIEMQASGEIDVAPDTSGLADEDIHPARGFGFTTEHGSTSPTIQGYVASTRHRKDCVRGATSLRLTRTSTFTRSACTPTGTVTSTSRVSK